MTAVHAPVYFCPTFQFWPSTRLTTSGVAGSLPLMCVQTYSLRCIWIALVRPVQRTNSSHCWHFGSQRRILSAHYIVELDESVVIIYTRWPISGFDETLQAKVSPMITTTGGYNVPPRTSHSNATTAAGGSSHPVTSMVSHVAMTTNPPIVVKPVSSSKHPEMDQYTSVMRNTVKGWSRT